MSDDWMEDLGLDEMPDVEEVEGVEEVEKVDEAPAPKSSKKKTKKKAARKPATEPEPEAPKPASKKKTKKKAAPKADAAGPEAAGPEAAEPEAAEPPPPPKRRGPKPGTKRKTAPVGDGPIEQLNAELQSIAEEAGNKAEVQRIKAEHRAAKQLATQLNRYAAKAAKMAESQDAAVKKLEAEMAKLES